MYKEYKSGVIFRWKDAGIITDDWDKLFERYMNTTHCEICSCKLITGNFGGNKKAIDHDHNTGIVRNICCHSCNMSRKIKYKNNTSGHKNIRYNKRQGNYKYEKQIKSRKIIKQFKSLTDALCYKFIMTLKFKAQIPTTILPLE